MARISFTIMALKEILTVCSLILLISSGGEGNFAEEDFTAFAFTQSLYNGRVREKAVSSLVECDNMMGMPLNNVTKGVSFAILKAGTNFQVSENVVGNFIFLELQSRSINRAQNVRVKATSRDGLMQTFCTVHVDVIDVNDFQPLFPPIPYSVSISEDTKVGTTIAYVKATDSDRDPENTRFYYSLPEFTSEYFAVDPITGAVTLTAQLNARTQAGHSVLIQATDRKAAISKTAQPKTTTLTVTVTTVNAHSPIITVHEPTVYDSTRAIQQNRRNRQVYAIFSVSDADTGKQGEAPDPTITHCDIPGLLEIVPLRKNEYQLVFLSPPPAMNGILNVTIEVSDLGTPPRTTRKNLQIKLFDKQAFIPFFPKSPFHMTISEFSPISSQVGFVSAELLNSRQLPDIYYSIESGNDDGTFIIDQNTSLITTVKRLNRNVRNEYRLVVTAVNNRIIDGNIRNSTKVVITVEDANDHDPVFDDVSYSTSLPEDAAVGTNVIRVHATDEDTGINGSVIYSLIGAIGLPFRIDPFNGTIFTTASLDFDVMSVNEFKLRVRASDRGLPFSRKSEMFVAVKVTNINDNPPIFDQADCVVSVPFTTAVNETIIRLEPIDIDRNLVTCSMLSGGNRWLEIVPLTCEIRLSSSLSSTAVGRHISLRVTASDSIHDSTPVVVNITISSSGNVIKNCRDTGAISRFDEMLNNLRASGLRDGKLKPIGFNKTSQIPNNYRPKVMLRRDLQGIERSESTPVGTVLARVRAEDRDRGFNGKLWYTITSGNEDACLTINTNTGIITLMRPFDRERKPLHSVAVSVSDLGTPSRQTTVRVSFVITDENDNAPVFDRNVYFFELPEDVPLGYRIQNNVEATDADEGLNAKIRYKFSTPVIGNKFTINTDTGYINVTGKLDREMTSEYNLTVIATDGSLDHPLTSSTKVTIRLADVNDNAPRFYRSLHRIRISEDLPIHALVFWLQAHDPDEGENGFVRYTLTSGTTNRNSAEPKFRVDDRTGAIRLAAKLDVRDQRRYNITVSARDLKKLYSTAFLEVEVLPVNRNLHAPYFEDRHLHLTVAEDAAVGTEVSTVSAIDDDVTDPEGDLAYFIMGGTGLGIFFLDENTGTITTTRKLDRETEQYYWLTVVAKDRATIPLSGHMFVLVEVTDVNDNAPLPSQPIYFTSVYENSPLGSVVSQINATDRDSGPGGHLVYSMPENDYFKIDPSTGLISTTKRRLDRETANATLLTFDVTITDSGNPPLSSVARVVVNLKDENDNSPIFSSHIETKLYLPRINRTLISAPIARVVALDNDSGNNSYIDYVMVGTSRKFSINHRTGEISAEHVIREGRSVIKVKAFDLGVPQLHSKVQRVEIEWEPPAKWSENPPAFNDEEEPIRVMYYEYVDAGFIQDESQRSGTRFLRILSASDVDSDKIWFRIIGGNEDRMFHINSDGSLFVTGEPDAETKDLYNLTVRVTDGHNLASKQVLVRIGDVNDHRPKFTEETFHGVVDENAASDTRVMQVTATDGDRTLRNRKLMYSIRGSVDPASRAKFRITPTGVIHTTTQLDRETQREHVLTIEVDDQGVPGSLQAYCHVIITVTDRNEHPPRFSAPAYFGQVLTGLADSQVGADDTVGTVVLRVQATDRDHGENARIFYSISAGNPDRLWKINPSTGDVTATRRIVAKDGKALSRSSFTVKATDGGRVPLSDTTQVTIDIRVNDDTPPRFEQDRIAVKIAENAPHKSFVAMATATAPSGVTYDITSGNNKNCFVINPHSGVISLAGYLDREELDVYNLVITSTSTEGRDSTCRVTVDILDINDNRPVFPHPIYTGYVSESHGSATSSSVTNHKDQPIVINATDTDHGDNGRVTYRIVDVSADIEERFFVDSSTGAIFTKPGTGLFDFESVKKYQFQVEGVDLGSPRLPSQNKAVVTIIVKDANDSAPAFTKSHYSVDLQLPTSTGVVVTRQPKAHATEGAKHLAGLEYSISSGNEKSAFEIDADNGALLVADASVLQAGEVYSLRLRVSNGKRSATSVATVTIKELSREGGLVFTQEVYEARVAENSTEKRALVVTSIKEMALDDYLRFTILNPSPGFTVGSTSGIVSTTGVPLDREEKSIYKLLIEAIDVHSNVEENSETLRRGRCIVLISVVDINDNSPLFVELPYYASVQVDAQPGTLVKQVRAEDLDEGKNSMIRFGLEGLHSDIFDIDARKGVVTLRRIPDLDIDDGQAKLNITVTAQDMGSPSLTGREVIHVSFVNRATPIFKQPFYGDVSIPEDAKPHTVVTSSVQASSPDIADVFYTIEEGDPFKLFDIDFVGGTITTRGNLDRERNNKYRLRVRARDEESRAHADVEVEITVTDVNDNSPLFSKPTYLSRLPETASVGSTVTQVIATDPDAGANGHVQYAIVNDQSADGRYFLIDPDTGVIWTARGLDSEEKSFLSFVVRANDLGTPERHTDVTVVLNVDDVNDNPPVFEKSSYVYEINAANQDGGFVGKVLAYDRDVKDQNKLVYTLHHDTSSKKLQIDPRTGVVSVSEHTEWSRVESPLCTNVSVSDGIFSTSVGFTVHFHSEDTSPTPLTFDSDVYNFTIMENLPAGSRMGKVSVTSVRYASYKLESETIASDVFRVDGNSGKIYTDTMIDREALFRLDPKNEDFVVNFQVVAFDNKGFVARCTVNVHVQDENDNSPVFSQDSYAAVLVPSESNIGDHVLKLSAVDIDAGENGLVSYAWDEDPSNAKQFFALDVDTGEVSVRERLRRLGNVDVLTVYVRAHDHGIGLIKSSLVSVSVYLASDPSSIPKFLEDDLFVPVSEDTLVGSEIATLSASSGKNGILYALADPYSTVDTPPGSMTNPYTNNSLSTSTLPFAIDTRSGRITTIRTLDREAQPSYVITVLARVDTTPELVSSAKVTVAVSDVNDNSPVFTSSVYQASIVENTEQETRLLQVEAHDADEGAFGRLVYSLAKPKGVVDFPFTINNKTGVISTLAPLDREVQSRYKLVVRAVDGGKRKNGVNRQRTSTCNVIIDVIDVNDNMPTFSQQEYHVSISESASVGQLSSKFLQVTDNDSKIASELRVYITDGDRLGQFEVSLDLSSSKENTVHAALRLLKPLDREAQSIYDLTLLVTDGLYSSSARVRLSVGDVNDNSPVCQQLWYTGTVLENTTSHTFILRVRSEDADAGDNGRVTYLLSGDGSDDFDLERATGELFTSRPLDREVTSEYWLTATSEDGHGRSCTSQIHIVVEDMNDNSPVFEAASLRYATRENTPVNSLLHRIVAHDDDLGQNGTVVFSLVDDVNGQFYIEPDSGVMILKKPLDRETVPSYELQILAKDKGLKPRLSSSATLRLQILDVNDNPPIFGRTQYEETLLESVRAGTRVGKVSAKSLDTGANANLKYAITHGNEHGKFLIHRDTGVVTLLSEVDYESDQSYVLTITASDRSENPLTSECTMLVNILDVNDNAPQFGLGSYQASTPEDAEVDRVVTVVSATDRDSGDAGNVTYSLSSKNIPKIPFRIDPISGKLMISSPGLDYETQSHYQLIVVASDSDGTVHNTEVIVEIYVTDVNDNRPQFVVSLPSDDESGRMQNSPDGTNCTVYVHESESDSVVRGIVLLNATDGDGIGNAGPFTFKIIGGNDADLFYLDSNNILKSRKPLKLNDIPSSSELAQNSQRLVHRLTIEVQDSGVSISLSSDPPLQLSVVVLKESQYAPEMKFHHVQITIPDNKFSGDLVVQRLHATDRDVFDQDRLRFSLASPEDFERFIVDPVSGAITAMSPLKVGTHNISIRVSDGSMFDFSTVSITVSQLNKEALKNSVSISFRGISNTEEYLALYHTLFVSKLRSVLPVGFNQDRDLLILSLQETGDLVQLLFAVRKPPSAQVTREFYVSKSLKGILEKSRTLIEEKLRVQVESIEGTLCPTDECEFGSCQQIPHLLTSTANNLAAPITTESCTMLTLRFERNQSCVCPFGKAGKHCESLCSKSNNPCLNGHVCKLDNAEENGYRCDPPAQPNTVMSFAGRSFVQYSMTGAVKNSPFKVSLRFRTFQSNGTLFYASGTQHFAKLETTSGVLRFTFDCGNGPQVMVQELKFINQGYWSDLSIGPLNDRSTCAFKVTLDGKYSASASGGNSRLDLDSVTFGGMPANGRSKRSFAYHKNKRDSSSGRVVLQGFRGCFEDVMVNDVPLFRISNSGLKLESKLDVSDACEQPDTCGPSTCKNNGYCLSDGETIRCRCVGGFTGEHCEISSACRAIDQCRNGGTCIDAGGSKVFCQCLVGWTGPKCEIDVNECKEPAAIHHCGGSSFCHNYDGGYACNCSSSAPGPKCEYVPTPLNLQPTKADPPILLILCAGGAIALILVVVFIVVCWRKRRNNNGKQYTGGSRRSEDITPLRTFQDRSVHQRATPPQIPQRPAEYQRSSRDSYQFDEMQEQRIPLVGYVRPQLPPVSPSMSAASDNDSIRKPLASWTDYDSKYNQSAASSVHHLPSSRKISSTSIADQQNYDWDVTDWKPGGSGVVSPAVANVAYGMPIRRGAGDVPSSPESRRSINSTSTCRSRRSHRSNALPGYYSHGRKRREKQLFQMVAIPDYDQDNLQIQRAISQRNKGDAPENLYTDRDSRQSSIRSSASRYHQSSMRRGGPLPPVPPDPISSPSITNSVDSYCNSFADNELEYDEGIEDFKRKSPSACVTGSERELSSSSRPSDSDSAPRSSGSELPPPPTEYELQALQEDDDDLASTKLPPTTSNNSYSSLLARPFDAEVPTPAVARSTRFHPDQYLPNHRCNVSDMSLASESIPGSNYSLHHPYCEPIHHRQGKLVPYEIPRPPHRHDSGQLAMSSLSEEDDDLTSEHSQISQHFRSLKERPPSGHKGRPKRTKKHGMSHSSGRNKAGVEVYDKDSNLLQITDDYGMSNLYTSTDSANKFDDVTDV